MEEILGGYRNLKIERIILPSLTYSITNLNSIFFFFNIDPIFSNNH
jgi:hypothetical protein